MSSLLLIVDLPGILDGADDDVLLLLIDSGQHI